MPSYRLNDVVMLGCWYGEDGGEHCFDEARLHALAKSINDFASSGGRVPVVVEDPRRPEHPVDLHESTPRAQLESDPRFVGYADMAGVQGSLVVDVDTLNGELPRRRGASVWMERSHRVNGREYAPFVRHILLTDDPAVKGQGTPIRLRLSPVVSNRESQMCTTALSVRSELEISRQLRAQRGGRSGARLAAAPAPRESTDPDYLEVKGAAMKLLAELGIDIDELPDATKEDLDWALRNFSWTPTNPDVSSPAALGRYALDAIFDSLVRVKAEEEKQGEASIDVSDHSATSAALRSSRRAPDVERELQLSRELRSKRTARKL